MRFLLVIAMLLTTVSAFANGKCALSCTLMHQKAHYPLATSEKFKPIGGYTNDQNTYCIYDTTYDNQQIRAWGHDIFGDQIELGFVINGQYISTVTPKKSENAKYELISGPHKLICTI